MTRRGPRPGDSHFAGPPIQEWSRNAVPFEGLYDVSGVEVASPHLVASGIALHYANLKDAAVRGILAVPLGERVSPNFVLIGGGVVQAGGLLRAVVDRKTTVPRSEVGQMPPPPEGRRSQDPVTYEETVRQMDEDMMYGGRENRGAYRATDGPRGSKVVYDRTIAYGGVLFGKGAMGLIDASRIERPGGNDLQLLPDDIIVGQQYSIPPAEGSRAQELLRISAVVVVNANIPGQRPPST